MANTIFERRSIRTFIDKPVEDEKLTRIIKAGMQAPSAMNSQPWEILIVTDEKDKNYITKINPNAKMVIEAPVLIITLANVSLMSTDTVWWPIDLSACNENMLLQIAEEGLGGVWIGFYPIENRVSALKEYYKLPENIVPFSVIALGYSNEANHFIDRYDPNKVHYGVY